MESGEHQSAPEADGGDYWRLISRAQESIPSVLPDVDLEASRLVMSLNRATRSLIYDLEYQSLRPHGYSDSAFRLLFVLWVAGPLSPHAAARLSAMARPTVSSLVGNLRRQGLVDRQDDPHDGRAATLSLTAEGARLITTMFADHNAREHEWAMLLTPIERKLLIMLLEKLMTGSGLVDAVHPR